MKPEDRPVVIGLGAVAAGFFSIALAELLKPAVSGVSPAILAAIIGSLTTVVTGVVGLGVLIWRLRKEAQLAIDENKSSEAMKLKLKIYEEEVVKVVDRLEDAQASLSAFIQTFATELDTRVQGIRAGVPASMPAARVPVLIDLKTAFDRAATEIVSFTERWLVIDPRFEIFRSAINAASHDVNASYGAYFNLAISRMPMELSAGGIHWHQPTATDVQTINAISAPLRDRLSTLIAYASDFQNEMQNALVGPLFGNAVPARKPIDPRYIVITLKDHASLARRFEDNTDWGRAKKQAEDEVRERLTRASP